MKTRDIEGATCAVCRSPVGLIQINGRTVETEPTAAILGRAIVIEFHRCPTPATSSSSATTRSTATRSGRKVM